MYVFDTSSFIKIFSIPRTVFPSMWAEFDTLVEVGKIISVREVLNELRERDDLITEWGKKRVELFQIPSAEEALLLTEIFKVSQYRQSLERKKLLRGGPFADPFVIAKAKVQNGIVVTEEKLKKNAVKIPNICKHFGISFVNLQGFMEREGWHY